MGFPKLFFVLICSQTLSSHPHFGVSEKHKDIDDGKMLIFVKMLMVTIDDNNRGKTIKDS